MKISIIVPVYNAEKYLHSCLDSILSQTFHDFELLLIDDGSTDGSGAICDSYASADSRIKTIHKENGGVSSARNRGIDEARGEWIYFCDADDTINVNCIELLLSNVSDGIDLVEAGFNEIINENDIRRCNFIEGHVRLDAEEYMDLFYKPSSAIKSYYHGFLFNKLFNRSVINASKLYFNKDIRFKEDCLFIIEYCCCMHGMVVVANGVVYNYKHRAVSATSKHNAFGQLTIDRISAVSMIYKTLLSRYPEKSLTRFAEEDVVKAYFLARNIAKRNGQLGSKLLKDGYNIAIRTVGKRRIQMEYLGREIRRICHFLSPLTYYRYIKRHIVK